MSEGHDDPGVVDARRDVPDAGVATPEIAGSLIARLPAWLRPSARRIVDRLARLVAWVTKAGKNPWVAGPAFVAAIGFHYARVALDRGIQKIHGEDGVGYGVNALNDGPDAVVEVFRTWRDGDIRLGRLLAADATAFARYQTYLEFFLIPFSAFVLLVIASSQMHRVRVADIDENEATPSGDAVDAVDAADAGDEEAADESGVDGAVRREVYLNMLRGAIAAAAIYALLGVMNQFIELFFISGWRNTAAAWVLRVSGSLRRLMLVLALVPIAVTAVQLERWKRPEDRFRWWRGSGTAFRVLLLAVVVHSLLLLFSIPGEQAADAVRLWADRRSLGYIGLTTTALLSLVIATIAIRLGKREVQRRVMTLEQTWTFVALSAAVTVMGVALWQADVAVGVLGLGIVMLVVAALSLPIARPASVRASRSGGLAQPTNVARQRLPAILATAPPVSLMVALINAAIPSLMDGSLADSPRRWALLYWAIAAAALAIAIFVVATVFTGWARSQGGEGRRIFVTITAGGGVVAGVLAIWATSDAVERAPDLGVIALVAIFMTLVATSLGTIGYVLESRAMPAALDIVGFRRVPIVSGLIVWAFVANQLSPGGFHDVRTIDTDVGVAQESLTQAFERWSSDHPPVARDAEMPDAVVAQPMVLIATAGGGLKAATFTAAAVDCVFGATLSADVVATFVDGDGGKPEFCNTRNSWSSVFMASGASGGSVGLASVVAESAQRRIDQSSWVRDRLGADLLSGELAWQLFVEGPNALLAFNPEVDRAAILERAWQRRFDGGLGFGAGPARQPFYRRVADGEGWEPLLYLSGTSLQDGCRVNIAPVRSQVGDSGSIDTGADDCTSRRLSGQVGEDADTRELTDYLCGRNIDLATAAFLSARFPYVSPVATQTCETGSEKRSLAIADGGYRDNSGAGSVLAAWEILDRKIEEQNAQPNTCIVPIVLEISSGYAGLEGRAAATDLAQVLAPAVGAANVFGDLSYGPIEELAGEFAGGIAGVEVARAGSSDRVDRYFRLSLLDHPGVTAPLGWSLSDAAAEDLAGQLELPANELAIRELISLLEPGALRCTVPVEEEDSGDDAG